MVNMASASSIRTDERAIRAKRNEAMNALIRRQPVEQPRDDSGRFAGQGLDQGSRGGEQSSSVSGGNAFLNTLLPTRLKREDA